MTDSLQLHAVKRERLLAKLVETLANDSRFAAGWLIGSLGRNSADLISDLDIVLAVTDDSAAKLLERPWQIGTSTISERMTLFSQYGDILYIYENHNNAPEGGTFTSVIYLAGSVIVDWSLVPISKANRPQVSRLLFAKEPIPLEPVAEPEPLKERHRLIKEHIGIFWLMTNIIVKYIYRNDALQFYAWLDAQIRSVNEIKRLLVGKPWEYRAGSLTTLSLEPKQQVEDLRRVAQMMINLTPELAAQGLSVPGSPMKALEQRLELLQQ